MAYPKEIKLGDRIAVIDSKDTAEKLEKGLRMLKYSIPIYRDYVIKVGRGAESELYGERLSKAREAVKEELAIWNEFDVISSKMISQLEK